VELQSSDELANTDFLAGGWAAPAWPSAQLPVSQLCTPLSSFKPMFADFG